MFKKAIVTAAVTAGVIAVAGKVISDILKADKEEKEALSFEAKEEKEETEE